VRADRRRARRPQSLRLGPVLVRPAFDVALELVRGENLGSPLLPELPGFDLALDELFRLG